MKKSIGDQITELQLALLQLQRSALIDTQTVMQLMIDKGICDTEDIVTTRSRIENESEDILRIDKQIEDCGGSVVSTPVPESISNKEDLKKQLHDLLLQLGNETKSDST